MFAQSFNDTMNIKMTSESFSFVIAMRIMRIKLFTKNPTMIKFHPCEVHLLSTSLSFTANYDPSEDEYARKNGHVMTNGEALENNNQPVTSQPTRMQRNISLNR